MAYRSGPHYPASLALWLWFGLGPWEVAVGSQGFSFLLFLPAGYPLFAFYGCCLKAFLHPCSAAVPTIGSRDIAPV